MLPVHLFLQMCSFNVTCELTRLEATLNRDYSKESTHEMMCAH